jgi:hypothetical protein
MGNWVDANKAENVLADFNEKEYLNILTLNKPNDTLDILTGDAAEAVGADSGVLKFEAKSSWDVMVLNFTTPIKLDANETLYIRMRTSFTNVGQMSIRCYDVNGTKINAQPTNPYFDGICTFDRLSATNSYTANEWFDFYITGKVLVTAFGTDEIAALHICTENASGTLYFDEIGFDANPFVVDNNLAENVVADYDEAAYAKNTSLGKYVVYPQFDDIVLSGVEGANGGVLKFTTGSYTTCYLGLAKEIKVSEVQSIEVRIKITSNASGLYIGAVDTDGKEGNKVITTYAPDIADGEWTTVSISAAQLASVYGADAVINSLYVYTAATTCGDVYVDQISVTPIA